MRRLLFALAVGPLFAQAVSVSYRLDSSWSTGLQVAMSVSNPGAAPVAGWTLAFDYPLTITTIWDARIVSHTGNHYILGGAGWNNDLAAHGTVSFGWVASSQNTINSPANCTFKNQPVSCGVGSVTDTVAPSIPVNLKSTAQTSTTISLAWSASTDSAGGSGLAGYDVLSGGVTIGSPTGATFTAAGLSPGTSYTFSVRARDNAGNVSGPSAPLTVATAASPQCNLLPGVPTGLSVLTKTSTAITIGWNASPPQPNCTASYVVTTDGTPVSVASTTYTAAGLQPASAHVFTVAAKNQFGSSQPAVPLAATTNAATVPVPSGWPTTVFSPYIDMLLWPTPALAGIQSSSGVNYFTMAFIVARNTCEAAWGGIIPLSDNFAAADIATLRQRGGDVIVSFGGSNGIELAQSCGSVAALQAQYQAVIDQYNLTRIDFDVEGAAVAEPASIDRRNKAIALLQATALARGRQLTVQFTLPVLPTGLTADGVQVLSNALQNGVDIGVVNVMAMDYGGPSVANPSQMGQNAVASMNAVFTQLQSLYRTAKTDPQLRAMQGVTPMIGLNDVQPEVFTRADAQTLLQAARNAKIGLLAMWSVGRDQPCSGTPQVSPVCSGVAESQYSFSTLFNAFTAPF